MALIGNVSVFTKAPGNQVGAAWALARSQFGKASSTRGRFSGWAGYSQLAATPNGHLPPSSFVLNIKPGGMSAYTTLEGSGAIAAANLAGGRNAEANLTGSGTISAATGQLVVSAVAALSGSGSISNAEALAVLQAAAALSGSGTVSTAIVSGPASMAADLSGLGTLAATVRAVGHMSADITPFETLSPQALAASVWNSIANQFNTDGTMGNLVNIIRAVLANRVVTDPVGGTYTVYDEDDTTVLVSGDLWQDADGTVPYSGSGAERRDRLI